MLHNVYRKFLQIFCVGVVFFGVCMPVFGNVSILQEIPYQLSELRDEYDWYLDYSVIGDIKTGSFEMEYTIKDTSGKVVDTDDTLFFSFSQVASDGVETGPLPEKGLEIKNGKGRWKFDSKFSKDMIEGTMDEGFIIQITCGKAVGLLLDFGNLGAVLDPGQHVPGLIPRNSDVKKRSGASSGSKNKTSQDLQIGSNKESEDVSEKKEELKTDFVFPNHLQAISIGEEDGMLFAKYDKDVYNSLKSQLGKSPEFVGRVFFSKKGFYGNTLESREKDAKNLDPELLQVETSGDTVTVSYPRKAIEDMLLLKPETKDSEYYLYSIILPQLAWKNSESPETSSLDSLHPFFASPLSRENVPLSFERKDGIYYAILKNGGPIQDFRIFIDESTMQTECTISPGEEGNLVGCSSTNIGKSSKKSIASFSMKVEGGYLESYLDEKGTRINLTKLFQENGGKDLSLATILGVRLIVNEQKFSTYLLFGQKGLFSFASTIATPKDISTSPIVVGLNSTLSLSYILGLYFSGNYFNGFFGERGSRFMLNALISGFWRKYWERFLQFLKFLIMEIGILRFPWVKKTIQYIWRFYHSHGNILVTILAILSIGVIAQVSIDDFNVFSLDSIVVMIITLFGIGCSSIVKDIVALGFSKKINHIEITHIPVGYVILGIIASMVRVFSIVPGVLFGQALRLTNAGGEYRNNLSQSKVLLYSLIGTYCIAITFWLLTLTVPTGSFLSSLFLVGYFSLTNDVFFSLIPLKFFWGSKIHADESIRKIYYAFLFITMFGLFHTIYNPRGDLNKITQIDTIWMVSIGIVIILGWAVSYYLFRRRQINDDSQLLNK